MSDAALMEIRSRAEFAEAPHPVTSYWFAYHDRRKLMRLYDALAAENAKLREALTEAQAALYGAREVCGSIGNIQHALDLAATALQPSEP